MLVLRYLLLIQVVGILLLHSLIPHRHLSEMTNAEHVLAHEIANDFIDYLGLAFQHSSNENSNYYIFSEQNSSTTIDLDDSFFLAGTNCTHPEVVPTSIGLHLKNPSQKSLDHINPSSNGLRAPPIHDYYS